MKPKAAWLGSLLSDAHVPAHARPTPPLNPTQAQGKPKAASLCSVLSSMSMMMWTMILAGRSARHNLFRNRGNDAEKKIMAWTWHVSGKRAVHQPRRGKHGKSNFKGVGRRYRTARRTTEERIATGTVAPSQRNHNLGYSRKERRFFRRINHHSPLIASSRHRQCDGLDLELSKSSR